MGWTDSSGDGHVSIVSEGGGLDQTFDFPARSLRGLAAHEDGKFAVLLWDSVARMMWLSKRNANGSDMGKGIGLATIDDAFQTSYVWLTNTGGEYESDPVTALLGSNLQTDRYLVGWRTTNDNVFRLGVINGNGNFLAGPEEVASAGVSWGNRDDSFRTQSDGRVSWVQGSPLSTTLHLYSFNGAPYLP